MNHLKYITFSSLSVTKHSCESQLFTVTDDFTKALNNKLQDVGILDLSKVFDKVPRKRLLAKFELRGPSLLDISSMVAGKVEIYFTNVEI